MICIEILNDLSTTTNVITTPPNALQDNGGWTPVIWGADYKNAVSVRYLLEHGADPFVRDKVISFPSSSLFFSFSSFLFSSLLFSSLLRIVVCHTNNAQPKTHYKPNTTKQKYLHTDDYIWYLHVSVNGWRVDLYVSRMCTNCIMRVCEIN